MPSEKNSNQVQEFFNRKYSAALSMLFIFFIGLSAFAIILGTAVAYEKEAEGGNLTTYIRQKELTRTIIAMRPPPKPPISYVTPETVKGVYATAYTAASSERLERLVSLIEETELNSIIIDVKTDSGRIIFDTNSPIIDAAGTEDIWIEDMPDLLRRLQDKNIYTIARVTVFQDPAFVAARPDLAIGSTNGGVWKDWKGVTWLDPHSKEVWEYVVAVADAAIDAGFQEINFDYIRFPSDGPLSQILYRHGSGEDKVTTMNAFFAYLDQELSDEEAILSADLFGITLWSDYDFNIGQTLIGAADYFDYIAPMVYPSHYPDGFNGYANPADFPYEIISENLARGEEKIADKKAQLRPWIQDFDLGAVYTPAMVRAEIRAAEEKDTNGWMLWNASNNYTAGALHLNTE